MPLSGHPQSISARGGLRALEREGPGVQLGPERTIEVKFQVRLWLEANLRQKDLPAEPCVCSETRLDGVGSLNRRGFLAGIAAAGLPLPSSVT